MISGRQPPAGAELLPDFMTSPLEALLLYSRGLVEIHGSPGPLLPWSPLPCWERIIFSLLTLIPVGITICLFAWRCRNLTRNRIRHMNYIRLLVLLSYILAIAFSFSSFGLVVSGIKSLGLCRNAIYLCIGFLYAGKLSMQLFLIERAHVANINYLRRRDDPIWWISMSFSAVAVIALTVWTYINPVYSMSPRDGRCRNGLPPDVVAPLQAFELTLNIILTVNFLRLLRRGKQQTVVVRPLQHFDDWKENVAPNKIPEHNTKEVMVSRQNTFDFAYRPASSITAELASFRITPIAPATTAPDDMISAEGVDPHDVKIVDLESGPVILPASTRPTRLQVLARKSLVGTLLMLCWSLANGIIFYITRGKENAWVCFVQCNFDVILSVFVLHWLTADGNEDPVSSSDLRSGLGSLSNTRHVSVFSPSIPSARRGPSYSRRDSYAQWGSRRDTIVSQLSNMDESVVANTSRKHSARTRGADESIALQIPLAVLALKAWERRRSSGSTALGRGSSARESSTRGSTA